MNLKAASRMFELDSDTATEADIKAKFKQLLHEVHPDSAVGESAMAGPLIMKYKEARDKLLANAEMRSALVDCAKCNGTGEMKTRQGGLIKCTTCGGEGEYIPKSFRRG